MLRADTEAPAVCVGNGSAQSVVSFSAIQRSMDIASEEWRVDVVEELETADDVLELPQRLFGAVLAPMAAEF